MLQQAGHNLAAPLNVVSNKARKQQQLPYNAWTAHIFLAKWRCLHLRGTTQQSLSSSPVRYHLYGRAKQQPADLLSLDASLVPRCYAVKF